MASCMLFTCFQETIKTFLTYQPTYQKALTCNMTANRKSYHSYSVAHIASRMYIFKLLHTQRQGKVKQAEESAIQPCLYAPSLHKSVIG